MRNQHLHFVKRISVLVLFLQIYAVQAEISDKVSFDYSVGSTFGKDNNIIVEELDFTSSVGDTFLKLNAKIAGEMKIDNKNSISGSLSVTNKNYSEADAFNLRTQLLSSGYKYKGDDITFSLHYRNAQAKLGGSNFLSLKQWSPALSFFTTKQHYFRLAYTSVEKELDDNPTRNANSNEISTDYYYFWQGLNDYFITSAKYKKEDAQDSVFNFKSFQARFSYLKRYTIWDFSNKLSLNFRYIFKDYSEAINPQINEFRKDTRSAIIAKHEVEIIENLDWLLEVSYTDSDSNLASIDYNEYAISTGFTYSF